MEVISWPVEVHRHQIDGIKAIFLAIGLRLDEEHLLGQAIWGVGFFRIAIPQLLLAKGDRCEFGIRTYGASHDEFLYAKASGLLDKLNPHDGVVVKELPGVLHVGADAAD